jgi:hypothetical protein
MKRTVILAALVVLVAALQSHIEYASHAAVGNDTTSNKMPQQTPAPCNWQVVMHPDATRFPINMDTHAGYAIYIYPNDGTIALKIAGSFPYSAFLSFTSYNAKGLLFDALVDKDIMPDSGSVNPFQNGALVNAPSRSYHALVLPNGQSASGHVSSVSMPPLQSGASAVLVMRVYLPEPRLDRMGGVPLPVITAVSPKDQQTPMPCPASSTTAKTSGPTESGIPPFGSFESKGFPQPPDPKDGKVLFYRPPVYAVPFADGTSQYTLNDCTGYLMATLSTEKIAVIHFKQIPSFFDNTNTTPTTVLPEVQVRYISLGSYGASVIPAPRSGLGGNIAGPQMLQAPDGVVTFVVIPALLPKRTKEAIKELATAKNFNVLPMAGQRPIAKPFLIYRNKVTTDGFEGSISKVPCYLDTPFDQAPVAYAATDSNMGPYVPEGVTCTVADFLSGKCGR